MSTLDPLGHRTSRCEVSVLIHTRSWQLYGWIKFTFTSIALVLYRGFGDVVVVLSPRNLSEEA